MCNRQRLLSDPRKAHANQFPEANAAGQNCEGDEPAAESDLRGVVICLT